MQTITAEQLRIALLNVCDKIVKAEPLLTELDTIIGDGDHGFGMRTGFSAMTKQLSDNTYATPYDLLHESGMTLIKVMGGTSGVIFGTLFIGGLSHIENKETLTLADLAAYIDGGTKAIAKRGKVTRGDKTMYDALIEASLALTASAEAGVSIEEGFVKATAAAKQGVENTKAMMSRKGRSKNFRDKTVGHPDTGAVSTSMIFEALSESFTAQA